MRSLLISFLMIFVIGCGSSSNSPNSANNPIPIEDIANLAKADIELLFIGNSHSSVNDLPGLVAKLIKANAQNTSVNTYNAPGWGFLDDRIGDGVTQATLEARDWTHVFLQAQKYSTTGRYFYPTDAAEEWVRRVKVENAVPIMFPEWPRRGNYEEGLRIHQLHVTIAQTEPACVAPVGLAWDLAIARHPGMVLHAADGNHSAIRGALLTAFVFYETITGNKASELPFVSSIPVPTEDQQKLRLIASETINENMPCQYLN